MQRSITQRRINVDAVVTAALLLYALVYLGWMRFVSHSPAQLSLLANLAFLPVSAGVAAAMWRASTVGTLDSRSARAWRLIAAAYLSLFVGNLGWLLYENVLGRDPTLSWANAPYLAYYPLLLAGLLSFPCAFRSRTDLIKFVLDAATVLVGGGMCVWYFVLVPTMAVGHGTTTGLVLSLAYPMGDLLTLLGIATVLLRHRPGRSRGPLEWLAVGMFVGFVADLVWAHLNLAGTSAPAGAPEALYFVAYVLVLRSSLAEIRLGAEATNPAVDSDTTPGISLLPYLAVAVGYGLLLGVSLRDAPGPLGGLVLGAVLLTVLVVARQITAVRETSRLLSEQATRASEARFRSLVQHASDVITILDEDSTIRYASPSVTRVFGYQPEAMVGHRLADFVHEEDRTTALAFMTDAVARPGLSSAMTWRIRGADGTWIRVENIGTNLVHDPNVGGLLLNTRDVSERLQLEEQLVHQAFHDPLTGLANRALFRNRVDHALARSRRKGGLVAVLFLDLDEFKGVNDSLGHAQGDRVLVSAAARLRACLRASDTPARLGGDEFAVLLEEAADTVAVGAVAERITQAFQEPVRIGTMDLIVTASIGIAVATGSEDSGDDILRNADVAMYMAKGRGRGRHEFFEPRMHTEVLERLEMQGDLRRAVEREEFLLHYQPILKMETGELVGAEALVRWAHPTRGLVPPGAFIPLAEETGLIVPIGRWVLRKACQQARQWRERHGDQLTITVNLSGRQLHDPDLMWHVISALAESELEPRTLVLELTESVLMQNTEVTLEVLRELKTLGIRLAIDDFGTGYSSLSYLQRFPFDILKIAKSFVDTMGDGKDDGSTLARAIIALGDTLELQTVAEGIETAQQAQSLRMLGCDLAQGFHFAKPLPPVEFAAFALRNRPATPTTAPQDS